MNYSVSHFFRLAIWWGLSWTILQVLGGFSCPQLGLAHISGASAGMAETVGVAAALLHIISHHLSQGSARYTLWTKSSLLLVCVNKVLLEYNHACLHIALLK